MNIEVTSEVLEALLAAAASAVPNEACGILLGQHNSITAFIQTRNVHPSPITHFEIDPQALIDAHRAARSGGPTVVGYFHSHPSSVPEPSPTDRAMAVGDGMIWAIAGQGEVRFYRSGESGFTALSSHVIES